MGFTQGEDGQPTKRILCTAWFWRSGRLPHHCAGSKVEYAPPSRSLLVPAHDTLGPLFEEIVEMLVEHGTFSGQLRLRRAVKHAEIKADMCCHWFVFRR